MDAIEARLKTGDGVPLSEFVDQPTSGGFATCIANRTYPAATWQSANNSDTLRPLDPARTDDWSNYLGQLDLQ